MRVLFLFKSEKETDEGHLKQMREGLRNNIFFFCLKTIFFLLNVKKYLDRRERNRIRLYFFTM